MNRICISQRFLLSGGSQLCYSLYMMLLSALGNLGYKNLLPAGPVKGIISLGYEPGMQYYRGWLTESDN